MEILKNLIIKIITCIVRLKIYVGSLFSSSNRKSLGLVLEEFFHKDLRGFGGYGMTAKNITNYYNSNSGKNLNINILLASKLPISPKPTVKRFHNAEVLFRPNDDERPNSDLIRYLWSFSKCPSQVLLAIEYYVTYEYILKALHWLPVIIYIRDPRGPEEWERLGAIPMELKWRKKDSVASLLKSMEHENDQIHKIIEFSKKCNRKIIFASNADFLAERAKKAYNLPDMKPYLLPNPLVMPDLNNAVSSVKPSLIFLGRLDPQKRIWMVFELASRFRNIDFIIAGSPTASYGGIMDPVINKYKHLDNLKFSGTVDGEIKWKAIEQSWGLINTSIHEGLPVTFLESLCMAKPIISCLDPDGLTTRFGYYTGDILGEGMDEEALGKFARQIELFLSDTVQRLEKGRRGREYVEERHTFENFDKHLMEILKKEAII